MESDQLILCDVPPFERALDACLRSFWMELHSPRRQWVAGLVVHSYGCDEIVIGTPEQSAAVRDRDNVVLVSEQNHRRVIGTGAPGLEESVPLPLISQLKVPDSVG